MATAQRLSALDATFVSLDRLGAPYVVGGVLVFDRDPVGPRVDFERIRSFVAAAVDRLPDYRRRIARVPLLRHPVWVDDEQFDITRHVHPVVTPEPVTDAQLWDLAGRLLSTDLPAGHPPWQMWIVDQLADGGFAAITAVHHCLVDGISGVRLLEHMLQGVPGAPSPTPTSWTAEPAPGRMRLLGAELRHRVTGLWSLRNHLPGSARKLLPALASVLRQGLSPAPDAGINPRHTGREHLLGGTTVPLAEVKAIKNRFGVTINDVVLATAAGALRRLLERRGVDLASVGELRAMVPVSTHEHEEHALSGSRVALLLIPLLVAEADPVRRLMAVHAATDASKRGAIPAGGELLVRLADVTAPSLLASTLRLSLALRGFNVIVTNVPGPPFPLYLAGARMRAFHPVVNLWPGQALGMALLSYTGTLHWSVHVDRAVFPGVEDMLDDLQAAFAELRSAASEPLPAAAAGPQLTAP